MNTKIRPPHLKREAYVYLRQSSPGQLEHNQESTKRQYALADLGRTLGWQTGQIKILDGDLGLTGKTTNGRSDFLLLMADVGLGKVGAVFSLEASRLSRSQADWHKLLDICALTDTLIIDHDGVYDPNDFNDRVLLGFKGTWSHTELHAMRIRMQGARLHKAKRGALEFECPTGYIHDSDGKLIFDIDEAVVDAVRLVFRKYREFGSAIQVALYFQRNEFKFPYREWTTRGLGQPVWSRLSQSRVVRILRNPTYSGAYVYGRKQRRTIIDGGNVACIKSIKVPKEEWIVCIKEAHPGYITWEEYMENGKTLTANRTSNCDTDRPRRPRHGAALLGGMVMCGKCGRIMHVRYQGTSGKRPYYQCEEKQFNGLARVCWSVASKPIDAKVEEILFSELTNENLDLSLAVLNEIESNVKEEERTWKLRLERAQIEVRRAERQYNAVEPENRLVARNLERQWNEKLQELDDVEKQYKEEKRKIKLKITGEQRVKILSLAKDIRGIWTSSTTQHSERKEILSLLVKQITLVPIDIPERQTKICFLWHTGATSEVTIERPIAAKKRRTDPRAVDIVAKGVAEGRSDGTIAIELNSAGFATTKKQPYTKSSVQRIRCDYKIWRPAVDLRFAGETDVRADGLYSTGGLAKLLGVSKMVIYRWGKAGKIEAIQGKARGPWWYKVPPEELVALKDQAARIASHHKNKNRCADNS